jgi:hypothetical protein
MPLKYWKGITCSLQKEGKKPCKRLKTGNANKVYPSKPGLVIGFHGCDISVRNKVVTGDADLIPSKNSYDWLGHGIYFWENNHSRAIDFANELKTLRRGASKIITPSVLGAVLDIGFCLDLLDAKFIELVQDSYISLLDCCNEINIQLPVNKPLKSSGDLLLRDLDCEVIEYLHFERKVFQLRPFDSVRSAFIEGKPLYKNAGFYAKNHIQISIRNPNCIKGYFIPRSASNEWQVP